MEDAGNLLYIIILIIAAISGAIRQNNKKKEYTRRKQEMLDQEQVEVDQEQVEIKEQRKSHLETIFERLEDILVDEEDIEQVEEYEKNEYSEIEEIPVEKSHEEKIKIFQTAKEEADKSLMKKENKWERNTKPYEEIVVKLEEDPDSAPAFNIHKLLDNNDDLKKAIVLSEIINRKY